jgi:hypothetical protein
MLLLGVSGLTLSVLLIAAQMPLLGELVAGLAVLPLTFAVYLRLLAAAFGPGGDDGGGPGGGGGKPAPPRPGKPSHGVDWDRFEREFRDYADERELVG